MARASHISALPAALAMVLVATVAFVAVPGCGNDFDGLFANGDAGNGAPPDNTAEAGATVDANTPSDLGPAACGAPMACSPSQNCGDPCDQTCNGCGCTCPAFDCNGGDAERCTTTCALGTTCSSTCKVEKSCSLLSNGATAKLTCTGRADCGLTCAAGGTCDLECGEGGNCELTCGPKSSCLVRCGGTAGSCKVDCQGGLKKNCPQTGVFTCNRDCPK
jgi:hypothetical protein